MMVGMMNMIITSRIYYQGLESLMQANIGQCLNSLLIYFTPFHGKMSIPNCPIVYTQD
jgi:hypothetical protein